MRRTILIYSALLLSTSIASAWDRAPAEAPQMDHSQQGGFMQGGMHHEIAKGVTLDARVDEAGHTVTLRVGPMNLPARTSHMKMPQPPDQVWGVPFDGWLLAYHPKMVDANGSAIPGAVLHHAAFWNENRSDFLCPGKEEHIFGAGSEMTDWAEVPGYGYHVQKGDKIRIETMVYNPTDTSYDKAYLEVVIPFQTTSDASPARKNVYPAWIDVRVCGNSSYDVKPGKSEESGVVVVKYDGVLLGVGGHLHDYGKEIVLRDVTRNDTVATLDATSDIQGHLQSIPVKLFVEQGGYKFAKGDVLKVSASYDNPTGKLLRDGAMGIAVGYFVPTNDTNMTALRRAPKAAHKMAGMSLSH
jgi:hypothetical protein